MSRVQGRVGLLAVLVMGQSGLKAQAPRPPGRAWSVSLAAGPGWGKSSQDVEAAMRAGDFDDAVTLPAGCFIFCGGPITTTYPYSQGKSASWLLTARRRLGSATDVRTVMGRITFSDTRGYKAGTDTVSVSVTQAVSTYALMVGINVQSDGPPTRPSGSSELSLSAEAWVAAGPALYRVVLGPTPFLRDSTITPVNRLGATVAVGLALPARKRVFVELQGHYRLVGRVDLGPLEVTRAGRIGGTVPRTGVDFNHGIMLVGLGVRL